ncbi:dimethylaniline monooxygenase [Lindgomyces ingoldianus]|uniref:Dimethylaniline monooxygenase n=1 Tax=Lindgomyces ingoldianus TaxID=673940 RepID=A0ACB6R5X5_9PLEO|nr:dimethylaniline monooxygenase [Lindgomyces ingoldianus]KAF2474659.1 dimethylaniline monooxygenase [Lindgomyces ingoldianus]
MNSRVPPRVAVIGAGISGVVTAAHLKREGLDVTVFERSRVAGGIWPCYFGLKNNVATRLLETTLSPFPSGTPDFVSHQVLKKYIQDTAVKAAVHDVTFYNTNVENVRKSGSKWNLEAVTLTPGPLGRPTRESFIKEFDFVVVASGHYHAPKVPNIPGLADWKRLWPDRVQHSKAYRKPDDFKGKNFLLIGGSVSSTDIARELSPLANNIYQSHRNGAFDLPGSLLPDNATQVDEIESFNKIPESRTTFLQGTDPIPATLTLKSGRKLCDVHHVIICTGYYMTIPFLNHLQSNETPAEKVDDFLLVTNGTQVHNLHKDIFYIPDPSLVFVGVPFFTATFTLFEFQAMVVAKVLSGQVSLPFEKEMRAEYQQRVKEKGYGKAFHSLRDKEVEYVNELLAWVNRDLRASGVKELSGHTNIWKQAKEEQVARMKAMFAGDSGFERQLNITC